MTKALAEILLFGSLAFNACLMIFIAGVLRKTMNDMDESAFRSFLVSLVRHSKKSPFMFAVFNIPFLGAIPYFYFYGFGNRWLLAALVIWLVAGSIAKSIKYPIYKLVARLDDSNGAELRENLRRMNAANIMQAFMNSIASILALVPYLR